LVDSILLGQVPISFEEPHLGFSVDKFFFKINRPLTSVLSKPVPPAPSLHELRNQTGNGKNRRIKLGPLANEDELISTNRQSQKQKLSLQNLVPSRGHTESVTKPSLKLKMTPTSKPNNLNFGERYWRETGQKQDDKARKNYEGPIYMPRARANKEDWETHEETALALAGKSVKSSKQPQTSKAEKQFFRAENMPRFIQEDTVARKVKEKEMRIENNRRLKEIEMKEAQMSAEVDVSHLNSGKPETPASRQINDSILRTRLASVGGASERSVKQDTVLSNRILKPRTSFTILLEEQHKTFLEHMAQFLNQSLRPMSEPDYWAFFKMALNKPIDHEHFQVLENDSIAKLPKAFKFAGEFRYFIMDMDQETVLKGKVEILTNKWLKVNDHISVPSLRDLVYAGCHESTEIAAILLFVTLS